MALGATATQLDGNAPGRARRVRTGLLCEWHGDVRTGIQQATG